MAHLHPHTTQHRDWTPQAHLTLAHSPPHTGGGLYIYHRLRYDPLLWKRELAIGKEGERKEGGGREGRQT